MDNDIIRLELFPLQKVVYSSNYKNITEKRFFYYCGLKRTTEKKIDGVWYTYLKIKDKKKWTLAKIKYGF